MKAKKSQLSKYISEKALLYLLITLFVFVVIGFELLKFIWPDTFDNLGWTAFYFFAILLVVIAIAVWGILISNERNQLKTHISDVNKRLFRIQKHQRIVFKFSRNLVAAEDEQEMIDQVLRMAIDTTNAQGAAFVPFDERQHPAAATSLGIMPEDLMNSWAEHLASIKVQHRCMICESLTADDKEVCPLLNSSLQIGLQDIEHVQCYTLQYGNRRVGMLTIFFQDQSMLDPEIEEFLQAIVDETALGLESIRLRHREMYALHQLQQLHQKTDLNSMVTGLLEDIENSVDADFSILTLIDSKKGTARLHLQRGNIAENDGLFIDGVLQGVISTGEPLMINDVFSSKKNKNGARAMLAVPIISSAERPAGALIVGKYSENAFSKRQLELLVTLAGYLALIVDNATSLSEIEYKTMLDERNRLAREIHDGLAQTLGFLKLQVAQLQNYLSRNDYEHLQSGLQMTYLTLADAYLEVRDAIDGLRTNPIKEDIERWLYELLADFEEASGIQAGVEGSQYLSLLAPEVQVQLIRIVQEGLSNVRKHSHASQISLVVRQTENEIIIELKDDGRGFSPDEVSIAAQYGLQGMRERAELICADFQVISKPHEGTTILLRVHSPKKEKA